MPELVKLVDKDGNAALVERGSEAEETMKKMGFSEPVFKKKSTPRKPRVKKD